MTVPTWSKIFDSEIDPESPITSSLIFRLRDNICAVLGIDPASVTVPTVPYPQSQLSSEIPSLFAVQLPSSPATSSENLIINIAAAMEKSDIAPSELIPEELATRYGCAHLYIGLDGGGSGLLYNEYFIGAPKLVYAAGVPDSVAIPFRRNTTRVNTAYYSGTLDAATGTISLPLDNAYHTIASAETSGSGYIMQAKARATSTDIYLQFRCDKPSGTSSWGEVHFMHTRHAYEAKA
jgi:hypothetical protein